MVYPALLLLMRTSRLPVVEWTDAPADLNGIVHFAERRNLVSARVPPHFKRSLPLSKTLALNPITPADRLPHFMPKIPHNQVLCSTLQMESSTSEIQHLFKMLLLFSSSEILFLSISSHLISEASIIFSSEVWWQACYFVFFNSSFKNFWQCRQKKVASWFRCYWKQTWISIHSSNHSSYVCVWKYSKFLVKGVLTDTVRTQNAYYTSCWQIIMENSSESSAFQLPWMARHYDNRSILTILGTRQYFPFHLILGASRK